MAGYDLLAGVQVLELTQLGPGSLGGFLADMGAEVIKVELPPGGDMMRGAEAYNVGSPDGTGFLHLRWNRGKKSVALDLRTTEGAALFAALAKRADVVIEGMRPGILERFGLGYEALKAANPRLVFCSLSGLGASGPYHRLGSHAPSYDSWGALDLAADGRPSASAHHLPKKPLVGVIAGGLYAAIGVLSALIKAMRTGEGSAIDVSAADCAAHWLPDTLDRVLNEGNVFKRLGFYEDGGSDGWKISNWPRFDYYRTRDGRTLFLQARAPKFWARFCALVGREDLRAAETRWPDPDERGAAVHDALAELFMGRDLAEWMDLFQRENIPAVPANGLADLAGDPHFQARENIYEVETAAGRLRLTGTPVKLAGQGFAPAPAPGFGEDTDEVLGTLLGLDAARIAALRAKGAIA